MATEDRYRECFLYVDADSVQQASSVLAGHLGDPAPFHKFTARGVTVEVSKNSRRLAGQSDDFVDWAAIVEVYADSAEDTEMVRFVGDLMLFLRSQGRRVVAACDFEDELPQTDYP